MAKPTVEELERLKQSIKSMFIGKYKHTNGEEYALLDTKYMKQLITTAVVHGKACTNLNDTEAVYLITDGACPFNGKENSTAYWGAILVCAIKENGNWVYPCKLLHGNVDTPTNNRAELTAMLEGAKHITKKVEKLIIITDSSYAKGALVEGNKRKKNIELIEDTERVLKSKTDKLHIALVSGHTEFYPHDLADMLATGKMNRADFGLL